MFTVRLGDRVKTVPYVTAAALRDVKAPLDIFARIEADAGEKETDGKNVLDVSTGLVLTREEVDVLVRWFCLFLQNAFTVDEIYELYPSDLLVRDIYYAALCVQKRITEALKGFPLRLVTEQESASE